MLLSFATSLQEDTRHVLIILRYPPFLKLALNYIWLTHKHTPSVFRVGKHYSLKIYWEFLGINQPNFLFIQSGLIRYVFTKMHGVNLWTRYLNKTYEYARWLSSGRALADCSYFSIWLISSV
jgi:hypothetical protein